MIQEKHEPTGEEINGEHGIDQETLNQITTSFEYFKFGNDPEGRGDCSFDFEARGHKIKGMTNEYNKSGFIFRIDEVEVKDKDQVKALAKKYGTTIWILIDTKEKEREDHKDDPVKDLLK